jgi:hypothetical protein
MAARTALRNSSKCLSFWSRREAACTSRRRQSGIAYARSRYLPVSKRSHRRRCAGAFAGQPWHDLVPGPVVSLIEQQMEVWLGG